MKHQYINEIKGILILSVALILLVSLISFVPEDLSWFTSQPNFPVHNWIGKFGAYLFIWSSNKFLNRETIFSFSKNISFWVFVCVLSALLSMLGSLGDSFQFRRGGVIGLVISEFLIKYCGSLGALIILFTVGTLALVLIAEFLVSPFLVKFSTHFKDWFLGFCSWAWDGVLKLGRPKQEYKIKRPNIPAPPSVPKVVKPEEPKKPVDPTPLVAVNKKEATKPTIRVSESNSKGDKAPVEEKPRIVGEYHLPSLDLLNDPPPVSSRKIQDDLMSGAKVLEETLSDFGVSVRVADIERGPVITRYELEPAPGVKVQKITALHDDIALAMRAQAVRIVAPIPGKNRVGVEVPNSSSSLVFLKDVIAESEFRKGSKLNLALGKDTSGKPLIANLGEMPHLLIAGTTGSGKTVCVNTIIMSMLFNASPDEVKFLMVDPKMVELSIYNKLPHNLCPAVTEHKKVSSALNWVVSEMERRYSLLAKEGVRNIEGYNKNEQRLPYIVVFIDELADLMQIAAKQIESAITRLAQLSRAVGIHLILATQRPSVDVITGVIKANFPARVSFKVASKVDSRTVLDMNGAENLLGKGDMLFLKPGEAKPIRGQCSLVSDGEIKKVIDFISPQQEAIYDETIFREQTSGSSGGSDERDELFDEALRLVMETNQASVSILQRRMRLGYTRAARLIDMMEQDGYVGPYCGSKPREILIDREAWLMKTMKKGEGEPQAAPPA